MDTKSFLKHLVETESPSHDKAAVDRVGAIVAEEARKLGAVGEGYHSEREYIFEDSLAERVKLMATLLREW